MSRDHKNATPSTSADTIKSAGAPDYTRAKFSMFEETELQAQQESLQRRGSALSSSASDAGASGKDSNRVQQDVLNGLPPFVPGADITFSRHAYIMRLHQTLGNYAVGHLWRTGRLQRKLGLDPEKNGMRAHGRDNEGSDAVGNENRSNVVEENSLQRAPESDKVVDDSMLQNKLVSKRTPVGGEITTFAPFAKQIHRQENDAGVWKQDKDGNLYYKTRQEAEKHLEKIKNGGEYSEYRITNFQANGVTYYRVEMRGHIGAGKQVDSDSKKNMEKSPVVNIKPLRVAGEDPPEHPYMIIRVGWTFDDGPTDFTKSMKDTLKGIPATWFISRAMLGSGKVFEENIKKLNEVIKNGGEIGIHTMHKTQKHGAWFPVNVAENVPKIYDSMAQANTDLKNFVSLLKENGIHVNFVRLTGGLISELEVYLKFQGVPEGKIKGLANMIIAGTDISNIDKRAIPVQNDYKSMQNTLATLNLHLWGGNGKGNPITSRQSWEAESSGSGLTDDVTTTFKGLVDKYPTKVKRPRSLIVLAHDTNESNVKEVAKDIAAMEKYAKGKHVKVEYYTLSDLFQVVRGEKP